MDYACVDNLEKKILLNSYYRTILNYAQLMAYIYTHHSDHVNRIYKIQNAIKNLYSTKQPLNITGFCNIIRFREVTPHLARLLSMGGIWELNYEKTYERLLKCHTEQACLLVLILSFLYLIIFISHGLYNLCLCGSGRSCKQSH